MFSAAPRRLFSWLGGHQTQHGATAAEPDVAPPAPPPAAESPPRAVPASGAAAACVPSLPRRSPRRPEAPPPAASRPPLLRRPDERAAAELDGSGANKAPQQAALRTVAALRASEGCDLSEQLRALGLPTGPWLTDEDAKMEINRWARDRKAAGGGFAVVWGSSKPAVAGARNARGPLHTLICHNHSEAKGKCGWSLTLEECVEGWAIRSLHRHVGAATGHNHELINTAVEARARRSMRDIPADLVELGKTMVQAGISNAEIFRLLQDLTERRNEEPLFNAQDVYHACGASTGLRRLDATNLVEYLREREVKEGLFQRTTTDDTGRLNQVFFVLNDAYKIYAVEPERQVVEIDHKVCVLHLRHAHYAFPVF
jgi:hypothetical protein